MSIDPNIKLHIRESHDKLLEKTDKRYAKKIVEVLVFGFVGLILMGVMTAIISLVIK